MLHRGRIINFMRKQRHTECLAKFGLQQPHAPKQHLLHGIGVRWLRLDLRGEELRADLAFWGDVARGPEELLPSGQPSDVVGVDGDEFGGVDSEKG